MTPIAKLNGVGPSLAEVLQANGLPSVEAVAAAKPDTLMQIPRIGRLRATKLIAEARKVAGTPKTSKATAQGSDDTPVAANGSEARATKEQLSSALAAAEAARVAAEAKAAKAKAKAKKAAKQAETLAAEFAAAKEKAKAKAKKVKAKAKAAIEKEKAKAKAILDAKASEPAKKKSGSKKATKPTGGKARKKAKK